MQRWAEFLSRPAKPIGTASRGRLEGQEVRIVEDRGVLQTCGEGREDGNWLRLEEATYMIQRELLSRYSVQTNGQANSSLRSVLLFAEMRGYPQT